jgi:hypothetical protein
MATIALARTARVEIVQSTQQLTLPADEAITPGAPVRINGNRFTNANGTTSTEADVYGIATGDHAVPAGMAVTAVKKGILDGFTFSGNTNAPVYVSDTDGRLDTVAGTVSKIVGKIVPGTAAPLGTTHKLLLVDL